VNTEAGNIWDTFWTIAAAVSGLGLPGAILLLLVGYFVVFLRWICRDSSFAEAWKATRPGRRLWAKVITGTGIALFLLNLPLCALEILRCGLLVASAVCVISIFSKSLRESTRLSHWQFWLMAGGLSCTFDGLLWLYCVLGREAAGLESFFPFMELVLVGLGTFLYFRVPNPGREAFPERALRLALCCVALLASEHSSSQLSYFLSYRAHDVQKAEQVLAESSPLPVSHAMRRMTTESPPRPLLPPDEEKVMKARVDFEEDLARVLAFFFGLVGFNAIAAVTSRNFGVRNAKSIPVALAPGLGSVPKIPEPIRHTVFFPDRQYRRGHGGMLFFFAILGNLFVSSITVFSTSRGNVWHFLLSFVVYSGMLLPPVALGCRNGFRLAAYRARSSLHAVRILMHNPSYRPLEVTVRKPTLLQRLQNKITGSWIRHAVDKDGKLYSLMFAHCPTGGFPAKLYQLRTGRLNESLTGRQAYVAIPHESAVPVKQKQRKGA
jgi:hypothetical protein